MRFILPKEKKKHENQTEFEKCKNPFPLHYLYERPNVNEPNQHTHTQTQVCLWINFIVPAIVVLNESINETKCNLNDRLLKPGAIMIIIMLII